MFLAQLALLSVVLHPRTAPPRRHAAATCSAPADLEEEVARRRNLAIISHPDAGKTTLTEKLLLYGGAISQAGAVKATRRSPVAARRRRVE